MKKQPPPNTSVQVGIHIAAIKQIAEEHDVTLEQACALIQAGSALQTAHEAADAARNIKSVATP